MSIGSHKPDFETGPATARAPSEMERSNLREFSDPRRAALPLPPEIDIAAGTGVPIDRILAAIVEAPSDVSPLQALFGAGVIGEERYYRALAERLGCGYYTGEPKFSEDFDPVWGLRCGVAPLAAAYGEARAVIAPRAEITPRLIDLIRSGRLRPESFVLTSPQRFSALVRARRPHDVLRNALARLPEELSAKGGLTRPQIAWLALAAALAALVGAASPGALSATASATLWSLFLAMIALRGMATVANPDEKRPRLLTDEELPNYTVVAAVYREAEVVEQLVDALSALDYPKSKLDIKIAVERRDRETLLKLLDLDLPPHYEVFVAPPGEPLTKPRALNLALAEARGELLVVYDAEDIPGPGQLRLAASRFAADGDLDCLQARLAIRNSYNSWLTRLFSLEYATLFDLINPGLCALRLPIALGGTSNHFRLAALVDVGAWDEWNVAEDADLGVRLARYGYRVGTLNSDTSEEAPHEFRNWFRQRMRWHKGWMQTCIVHSRRPLAFLRDFGARRAAAAAVLVFGSVLTALFWPAFALSTLWRAFGPGDAELPRWREGVDLFVYILACAEVWSVVVPAAVAARQRGLKVGAGAFAALPFYYALVSAAAWAAIVDLIVRPHFWAKTAHGRPNPARLRSEAFAGPRA